MLLSTYFHRTETWHGDYSLQARYYLKNLKKKNWENLNIKQIKTCLERISGWQED